MDRFEEGIEEVFELEGYYSDHPDDTGGKTTWGITESVARAHGYEGDMKDLTKRIAKEIYRKEYYEKPGFDKIEDDDIAIELFEEAVNMYIRIPVINLQKIYNMLTGEDIAVDGRIGPETLNVINNYDYPKDIFLWQNILQGSYYWDLAEANDRYKTFLRGWGRRLTLER